MTRRILFVDDEPNILEAIERQFRKRYEIRTAIGPEMGLKAVAEDGPFAVVISDLRMPRMDGVQFLARVKQSHADTVRLMLTGNADLTAAIAAVNEGHIFRFLSKPCPPGTLEKALDAALEQHRLITSERELLEKTLHGAIQVMSDILSLANPAAFSRAERIQRYMKHICREMNSPLPWQYELAALLSQIGCVAVPADVLDKIHAGEALTAEEEQAFARHSEIARDLLIKIPRLEDVATMIAAQRRPAWELPAGTPETVRRGARMLRVAADFDDCISRGRTVPDALEILRIRHDYDATFVNALEKAVTANEPKELRDVTVAELRPGMITDGEVRAANGILVLARGYAITESAIARLRSFMLTMGLREPIRVAVPLVPRRPA